MSDTVQASSWSAKKFWQVVVLIFLAQFILILVLSERGAPGNLERRSSTFFRLLATSITENDLLESVFAGDPTLFILPERNGFSGLAWLNPKTAQYAPPQWDEPPRFLPLNQDSLGNTILEMAQKSSIPPVRFNEQFVELGTDLPPTQRPAKPSSLRVEGDIRERFLAVRSPLRSWERAEVLGDSAVRIAVDGAGNVVTALLLQPGSGWRAADEEALAIARSAKFQPVNTGSAANNLQWGTLVVRWQTVPVSETNTVNAVVAP